MEIHRDKWIKKPRMEGVEMDEMLEQVQHQIQGMEQMLQSMELMAFAFNRIWMASGQVEEDEEHPMVDVVLAIEKAQKQLQIIAKGTF